MNKLKNTILGNELYIPILILIGIIFFILPCSAQINYKKTISQADLDTKTNLTVFYATSTETERLLETKLNASSGSVVVPYSVFYATSTELERLLGHKINDWVDAVSPSSHVAAGTLPADVQASSVAASVVEAKNLNITGTPSASTYVKSDGSTLSYGTPAGGGGGTSAYRTIPLPGIGACYVTTDYVKSGPLPCDMTISSWTADFTADGTAPVGGEGVGFDVMWSTGEAFVSVLGSTDSLRIAASAKFDEMQSPVKTNFLSGTYIRLDIKGIGTTTAGGAGNWFVAGHGKDD